MWQGERVRPPADNYNHLSVPDPATACGNLLYRAGGGVGEENGSKRWFEFLVSLFLCICCWEYSSVVLSFMERFIRFFNQDFLMQNMLVGRFLNVA